MLPDVGDTLECQCSAAVCYNELLQFDIVN